MTTPASISSFYLGKINLWVEDQLTAAYLRKVWNDDPAVKFYVGGGNEGVRAILQEAQQAGLPNVFAYVDKDFGLTNRPDWNNPVKNSHRFVSSVHEIENHLLDADALASCSSNTGNRLAVDITARLHKHSSDLTWWMATRCVIAELRKSITEDFPEHPKCPAVVDQTTAEAYLASSTWCGQMQAFAPTLTTANLNTKLATHHAAVASWLTTDKWLREFPGKELFHHIRGWVYPNPPSGRSTALLDEDLGKEVGEWQVTNKRVPQELDELLAVLKRRVGVP